MADGLDLALLVRVEKTKKAGKEDRVVVEGGERQQGVLAGELGDIDEDVHDLPAHAQAGVLLARAASRASR